MEHAPIVPENTSGQGSSAIVPPEIKRWNWTAFLTNWVWAIGMRTWIGLLAFLPYVALVVSILLGVKGNEWAWRKRKWESVEQFKRVQRIWAYWILPIYAIQIALVFLVIRPFLVQAYFIPSQSMTPTFLVDDRLLGNKLIYHFRLPRRGEIVIFETPQSAGYSKGKDFAKRVIALPGDTIQVRQGSFFVNGRAYDQFQAKEMLGVDYSSSLKLHADGFTLTQGHRTKTFSKHDIAEALGDDKAKVTIRPGAVILNGKPLDKPYYLEDPNHDCPKVTVPPGSIFVMGDNLNNSNDSQRWGFLPMKLVKAKAWFIFSPTQRMGLIR